MKSKHIKDILTDVLRVGELGSHIVCRPKLPSPWGLVFTPENKAYFHIVKKGSCFFYPDKKVKPIVLHQGDVLFIPKVGRYSITSSKETKGKYYIDEIKRINKLKNIDDNRATHLICGSYELSQHLSLPFFSQMPKYMHITSEEMHTFPELGYTIQMLIREDSTCSIGSDLLLEKIIDILLIQVIRFWLENCQINSVGWLMATLHSEVGKVLSIIHERPSERWTLESLAKESAISRTKLFNKFTKEVGISPIQYLTNWRIDLSKKLLQTSHMSILEIANAVGYESEAAFGRVFKKIVLTTPGKFRSSLKRER